MALDLTGFVDRASRAMPANLRRSFHFEEPAHQGESVRIAQARLFRARYQSNVPPRIASLRQHYDKGSTCPIASADIGSFECRGIKALRALRALS
jgi:hypothetical protein